MDKTLVVKNKLAQLNLSQYSYELIDESIFKPESGDISKFTFINRIVNLRLAYIYFVESDVRKEDSLGLVLTRYTPEYGMLDLQAFCEKHKLPLYEKQSRKENQSFEDFVDSFIAESNIAFSTYLQNLLNGTFWEEIKIDWMGTR